MRISTHFLRLTGYCTALSLALSNPALAAFDPFLPDSKLPDVKLLSAAGPKSGTPAGASPLPTAPLYPTRADALPQSTASGATPTISLFPPVDPATALRAQQELQPGAAPVTTLTSAPTTTSFIAPAPLIALPPAPAGEASPNVALAPPITLAPISAPTPLHASPSAAAVEPQSTAPRSAATELSPTVTPLADPLSTQSKTILSRIPSKLDSPRAATKSAALKLDRVSPEIADLLGADAKDAAYEAVGLSIKVRRPGLDVNYELNRAYTALMGGDTSTAIQVYKDILSTEPGSQDALFGLAATYHRLGESDKARPLYGALLKVNPNHREGLNNFLALISDESPQEALAELERLEQRNPDFSPIPAQQALVLDKLGYVEESRTKMLRAIQLAPDNLTYKYNLAVMSDRNGQVADASALYRILIEASLRGAKTPAPLEDMQKRLNFITSEAAAEGHAAGS